MPIVIERKQTTIDRVEIIINNIIFNIADPNQDLSTMQWNKDTFSHLEHLYSSESKWLEKSICAYSLATAASGAEARLEGDRVRDTVKL